MSLLRTDEQLEDMFSKTPTSVDPAGLSGLGKGGNYNVTKQAAHPLVRWASPHGDVLLTCDVYQYPGAPIEVHLYCPKCAAHDGSKNMLRISGDKKKVSYDPSRRQEDGGELNVERFTCSWTPKNASYSFGINRCNWSVEISNNVAR